MSSVKRKIMKIVAVVIGIFAVLNLFWFGWRQILYSSFIDGMEQTELSTLLVDKETGVHYLFVQIGHAGGLTPLLDAEGHPVIKK